MKGNGKHYVLLVCIVAVWGSFYVASRVVLQQMPALFLLFLRFSVSSVFLLGTARYRKAGRIAGEDLGELFLVAFAGYFISNGALLMGIQYSNASFSSLINSTSPIFISLFAVLILKESMHRKDVFSVLLAVAGAAVISGNPGRDIRPSGIIYCAVSLILWSYVTIHIKKLTQKYDSALVTGSAMEIAALFALPASLAYMHVTGETIRMTPSSFFPVLYIAVICTAVCHCLWNWELSRMPATLCVSFCPLQPLTSVIFGVLLLGEELNASFYIGAVFILAAMLIHFGIGIDQRRPGMAHAHGMHS